MSTLPLLLADAVIYHFPPSVNNGSNVITLNFNKLTPIRLPLFYSFFNSFCDSFVYIRRTYIAPTAKLHRTFYTVFRHSRIFNQYTHGFHHLPSFVSFTTFPPSP